MDDPVENKSNPVAIGSMFYLGIRKKNRWQLNLAKNDLIFDADGKVS